MFTRHAPLHKLPVLHGAAADADAALPAQLAAAAPENAPSPVLRVPPVKLPALGGAGAGAGAPLPAALAGIKDVQGLGCDDVNLAAYRASASGFGIWPVSARFSGVQSCTWHCPLMAQSADGAVLSYDMYCNADCMMQKLAGCALLR